MSCARPKGISGTRSTKEGGELAQPTGGKGRTSECYLDVFRFLQSRDEELAHAFNDPRRSRMIAQLAAIYAYGLLEPDELKRFSDRTRVTIKSLAGQFTG